MVDVVREVEWGMFFVEEICRIIVGIGICLIMN